MIKNLIKSKRSTASDTGTKKNKGFRLYPLKPQTPDIDHILDMYWGGPERRITKLTLRIITVNAIALLMLMAGTLYLGQYQRNLIEAKLVNFETELTLTSQALAEAVENKNIIPTKAEIIAKRMQAVTGHNIHIFAADGTPVKNLKGREISYDAIYDDESLESVRVLKSMISFIIKLLPDYKALPTYPEINGPNADDFPDAKQALEGTASLSVWHNNTENIFLSAAAPIYKDGTITGSVLMTRLATDIETDIGDVWINILIAFGITLILTVFLSIYLTGVIVSPLRRLANAAEKIRTGKVDYAEIPDLSDRKDEIGELSVSFGLMTKALWERMDLIERFAADVAHELKNPLTSLKSAIETLGVVTKKKDRNKLLEILQHDVERLDRLITDISASSRLDAELSREALESLPVNNILENIANLYGDPLVRQRQLKDEGQQITVQPDNIKINIEPFREKSLSVLASESRLLQVLENVLSNAISFSPKNGEVSVLIQKFGKHVHIIVQDQGPGIPENKLNNIFERFYSERPEHEDYGQHSGLGLSICRQIITAFGGKIYAQNVHDKEGAVSGAIFTIVLKRA